MSETSPSVVKIQWFFAGCVITAVLFYLFFKPKIDGLSNTQNQANFENQRKISALDGQLQQANQERDTCTAKFQRATILYDVGLLNGETRAWVIPVDVEPKIAAAKRGSFSHYDPKTQTETVHFQPKAQ